MTWLSRAVYFGFGSVQVALLLRVLRRVSIMTFGCFDVHVVQQQLSVCLGAGGGSCAVSARIHYYMYA